MRVKCALENQKIKIGQYTELNKKKWGECVAGKRQIDPFKSSVLLWDISKQCRTRLDITERGV